MVEIQGGATGEYPTNGPIENYYMLISELWFKIDTTGAR
jgi:hypothetical protein